MAIGFTGTRHVGELDKIVIHNVIETIGGHEIVTGGCVGADATVAQYGYVAGHDVHVVLPADRRQVDLHWAHHCASYEEMPPGSSYRDRNQRIVDLSDRLIAFPEYPEAHGKSRRSGTWMTVRLARKAGIPVEIHVLRS